MPPLELRRLWYLDGRKMALWSEPSRRRLRRETQAISQILAPHIPRSCTHVRGHGGVKGALRQIHRRLPKARFVARFDIAAYYTSMRHDVIEAQVAATDLDAHLSTPITASSLPIIWRCLIPKAQGLAWWRAAVSRRCSGRST